MSDCNYIIEYILIIYTLLSLLVITSILGNSLACLAVTTDPNLRLSKNPSKHTAASNIPNKMEGLKKNIFLAVSLTVKIPFSRNPLKTLCSSGNCRTCSWSAWQSPIYSLPSSSCPLPSSMICRFPFMYSSLPCQGFIAIVWYITRKYSFIIYYIHIQYSSSSRFR